MGMYGYRYLDVCFLIFSIVCFFIMVFYNYKNFKTKRYDKASSISSFMYSSFLMYFLKFSLHWGWLYSFLVPLGLYGLTLIIIKNITKNNFANLKK